MVGLLHKGTLDIKPQKGIRFESFEHKELLLKSTSKWTRIIVIYRPPPSKENGLTVPQFLEEFQTFLETLAISPGELLLMGDFNFHIEDHDDNAASRFCSLLGSFDLAQHVCQPTHRDGHTLDLVITRTSEKIIEDIFVTDPVISDHSAIHFKLCIEKPKPLTKTVSYRKWKHIDLEQFKNDISESTIFTEPQTTVDNLVLQYNTVLSSLVDRHAPLKIKTITIRPSAEWYTEEIDEAKRVRRRLEKRSRRTGLYVDSQQYESQCYHINNLLVTTKEKFYCDKIQDNPGDHKALFQVTNKLLNRQVEQQLPAHDSLPELAEKFADFFVDKIEKIKSNLQELQQRENIQSNFEEEAAPPNAVFSKFEPATEEEVKKLISDSANKSCSLDPMPTWLVKECMGILLPIITKIVNLSLYECVVPSKLKEAILTPLLKKISLDYEVLRHFRPISNLAYISKLVEKIVAVRVTDYAITHNLYELMQSSYKMFHSTETAMIRVQNDLLHAIDSGNDVLLVLLDLSAAFDTVDHEILLKRLTTSFGITGSAHCWFRSYLSNRKQTVTIQGASSTEHDLSCGVPQGSVLGPLLFNIYTLPLGTIIRRHNIEFHLYADDSQLYLVFKRSTLTVSTVQMEELIAEVKSWMVVNMLGLNDDKTEFLVIHSKYRPLEQFPSLTIGSAQVSAVDSARALGVRVDNNLTMEKHVSEMCKKSFLQLRELSRIRKCIPRREAEIITHAFITSRLDYCNSLLYGLPDCTINRLQKIQNSAARLITLTRKYDHITPVLQELHWLPVQSRIKFKILLLTYKALHGIAPQYLTDLLQPKPARGLRSDNKNFLVIPDTKLKTYGDRAFSKAAPYLWNSIPQSVRMSPSVSVFKSKLKTYMFAKCYVD